MKKTALYKSFLYALKGIWYVLKSERNFQIHTIGLIINLILFYCLKVVLQDIIIILLVSCFVLVTELLNTAIEKICDFIHPNFNKRIGIIKDISAGAVFIAALFAIVVGVLIYQKYFF